VVAATVRDLAEDVKTGRFREDLFYRLNVLLLDLPPLRERMEDVPPLVEHFIQLNNTRLGLSLSGISSDAMKLMMDYPWPGNVRELENTIEHAMVLSESEIIEAENLPVKIRESQDRIRLTLLSGELSVKKTSRIIEEELIRRALKHTGGNRTSAAKLLEISHRALLYKIKEYGITDL
jgi:two-component system response regulator AtoC